MTPDEGLIALMTVLTIVAAFLLADLYRHGTLVLWLFVAFGAVVVNGLAFLGAVWWENLHTGMAPMEPVLSWWAGGWFLHLAATLVGALLYLQHKARR